MQSFPSTSIRGSFQHSGLVHDSTLCNSGQCSTRRYFHMDGRVSSYSTYPSSRANCGYEVARHICLVHQNNRTLGRAVIAKCRIVYGSWYDCLLPGTWSLSGQRWIGHHIGPRFIWMDPKCRSRRTSGSWKRSS